MRKSAFVPASILFLSFFLLLIIPRPSAGAAPEASPWLGVTVIDVPPGTPGGPGAYRKGVVVTGVVKDSPAEKAGLDPDDVIVGVNGREVYGAQDFATEIKQLNVGEPVALELDRNGQIKTVDVMLVGRPESLFTSRRHYHSNRPGPERAYPHGEEFGVLETGKCDKMFLLGIARMLGLDRGQEKAVEELQGGYLKATIKAEAEIRIAEVELYELTATPGAKLAAVKAKIDEIARKRAAFRFAGYKALDDLKKILTPRQLKDLDQMTIAGGVWGGGLHGSGRYGVYVPWGCAGPWYEGSAGADETYGVEDSVVDPARAQ